MAKPINLTKLLAEYFYAVTLYDYRKNEVLLPDELLERYATDDGRFDIDRIIEDAKTGEFKKDYYDLLLPADLLTADSGTLKEISAAHADIQKKSMKGGYIRAVLEVLHDKRFREEFNKKTEGLLDKAPGREDFILLFLDTASTQDGRGDAYWDYSSFTEIKQIGKKVKGKKMEMVKNPYSAYKVFGQGEYSKLLIGYRADPSLSLDEMRKRGVEVILTDNKICGYGYGWKETKATPYESVWKYKLPEHQGEKADVKMIKPKNDKAGAGVLRRRRVNTLILDMQMDAVTKILQQFNRYVPWELDSEAGDGKLMKDKLSKMCRHINKECSKGRYPLDILDEYEEGSLLDKNEQAFINKYFNMAAEWRTMLWLRGWSRKAFDELTHWAFQTKKIRMQEKLDALNVLIYSEKALMAFPDSDVREKIRDLARNEEWLGIVRKFKSEMKNPRYPSDRFDYDIDDIDKIDEKDNVFYSGGIETPEEQFIEKEPSSMQIPADILLSLFDDEFSGAPRFLESIRNYIKHIDTNMMCASFKRKGATEGERCLIVKKELKASAHKLLDGNNKKKNFDSYLDLAEKNSTEDVLSWRMIADELKAIDKDWGKTDKRVLEFLKKEHIDLEDYRLGKLKMGFALECLDKEHSWEGSFNLYKKRELDASSDIEQEETIFKEKMSSINKRFRQRMGC